MKKHFFITIIAILLLLSCGDSKEKTQTVKVKNSYTMELPEFLTKTTTLSEEASLQYQNIPREIYIMVIDEPKSELKEVIAANALEDYYTTNLDGYAQLLYNGIDSRTNLDSMPNLKSKKLNGLDAKTCAFTGTVQGLHIYWSLAFVEGKNNYYQVMTWTLLNKKEEYKDIMDAMTNSFKEIDKNKK